MANPGRIRVIAGTARGLRLQVPAGKAVRPTLDRVREAVFSIVGPEIVGARFLDLYAGSGANGIEALSRGAASSTFVESDRAALDCIRENLARTKLAVRAEVLPGTAIDRLRANTEPYDFIFADPPYALDAYYATIQAVAQSAALRLGGWLLIEHESTRDLSGMAVPPLVYLRTYRYGQSAISIFENPKI